MANNDNMDDTPIPTSLPFDMDRLAEIIQRTVQAAFEASLRNNTDLLRGPHGSQEPQSEQGAPGQLTTTDTTWNAGDICLFDPSKKFKDGMDTIQNVCVYSDVYTFVDHMTDLILLKSEAVVRANMHSCLRGDALRWYSLELTADEKMMMNQVPLKDGWFSMMTYRFKTNLGEVMLQLDRSTYGWEDVRRGRTPRDYAYGMLRLCRAMGKTDLLHQLLRIRESFEPSLRLDIPHPTAATTLVKLMESLDSHYRDWKDIAAQRQPWLAG